MCTVKVTCNCGSGDGGFGTMVGLAAIAVTAVTVVPVIIGFLTSLVVALVTAVGIVTAGWVLKGVAVTAIEEYSLHRHNRRMAAIYPHVAQQLGYAPPVQPALPPSGDRLKAHIVEARVVRRGEISD